MSSSPPSNPGYTSIAGSRCLVTGSSGLVGGRLVVMLLERGASLVRCFDLAPPPSSVKSAAAAASKEHGGEVEWVQGDLTDVCAVRSSLSPSKSGPIDVCYHIAALVGPYFPFPLYYKVNYQGSLNVLSGCQQHGVKKLVMSSSPSTRFTGADIKGARDADLPYPETYLQPYAETKAMAERAVREANDPPSLMTVAVAPHQVYGPEDRLFLPNLMEAAGKGMLRVFGDGENLCSFCHVDNYCHGLMCGSDALYPGSPALSSFYIVTDSEPQKFWHVLNSAAVGLGFDDMFGKFKLPGALMLAVAWCLDWIGWAVGRKFKLSTFSVRMLLIHRHFDIKRARDELKYEPMLEFEEGWEKTLEWMRENWLPGFLEKRGGTKEKKE